MPLISAEAKAALCKEFKAMSSTGSLVSKSLISSFEIGTPDDRGTVNGRWQNYLENQKDPYDLELAINTLVIALWDVYLMYNTDAYPHLYTIMETLLTAISEAIKIETAPKNLCSELTKWGSFIRNSMDLYDHIIKCDLINKENLRVAESKNTITIQQYDLACVGGIIIGFMIGGIGGVVFFGPVGGIIGAVGGAYVSYNIAPPKECQYNINLLKNLLEMQSEMKRKVHPSFSPGARKIFEVIKANPRDNIDLTNKIDTTTTVKEMLSKNPELFFVNPVKEKNPIPPPSPCLIL